MTRLMYVGQEVADSLKNSIAENLDRYVSGDFADLESGGDWRIPLTIDADLDSLQGLSLDSGAQAEITNAELVGKALGGLTPSLARENRIWVRLSHVECLEYSRARWLAGETREDVLAKGIQKHFFATTLNSCRDDHAIARLWWAYRIAKQAMPEEPRRALGLILARADIRLNLVERPGIGARAKLCAGVLRLLERDSAFRDSEPEFRSFMKWLNLLGAGIAFEVWRSEAIDRFLDGCLRAIRQPARAPDLAPAG
jgi:hypothetical protein